MVKLMIIMEREYNTKSRSLEIHEIIVNRRIGILET